MSVETHPIRVSCLGDVLFMEVPSIQGCPHRDLILCMFDNTWFYS